MGDLTWARVFSLRYNGVRFFFQHCIRHEGNFFQCRILFFPGISLQAFLPRNQCTGYFLSEINHNLLKSQIIGRKKPPNIG